MLSDAQHAWPDARSIVSIVPTFFLGESDYNRRDKLRLDFVVAFNDSDGVSQTVRYHPNAHLIWSQETQPTSAMQGRLNRAAKLRRLRVLNQPVAS